MKALLFQVFKEQGPLDPYTALSLVRQQLSNQELTPTRFFELFHELRNDVRLIPTKKTVFIPTSPEEKRDWDFSEIPTHKYRANGENK